MDRIVVITGTRKGIGKFLAGYFIEQGDTVIGCSRRNASIDHPAYKHYSVDVSNEGEVVSMVKEVARTYKRIDILINNAGAASMNHFLLTPASTVKSLMETNFIGTFVFCREVSKVMIKQKYGRIINFSTVAVPLNLEGELAYSSSKAAVEQLTKVMAGELGATGITVNAIGPTPIATDLIRHVPEQKIEELLKRQSIKRLGEFRDVLNAVNFFISEQSDFVTGQVIYLGGVN